MNLINLSEAVALGGSFFSLHTKNHTLLRLILLVMVITATAEALGFYLRVYLNQSNHNIFNVSVVLVIILLLYIFQRIVTVHSNKRMLQWLLGIFIVFMLVNFTLIQGMQRFATYNYIVGGILLCIAVLTYFSELIKVPKKVDLLIEPFFWLGSGIILMYIPKSVLYSVFEYLSYTKNLRTSFAETFSFLNTVLSIIFYVSITIACTCRWIFRT